MKISDLSTGSRVQRTYGDKPIFSVTTFVKTKTGLCALATNVKRPGHKVALYNYDFESHPIYVADGVPFNANAKDVRSEFAVLE